MLRVAENPDRPLPKDASQHYPDFVPAQMRLERQGRERSLPRGKVTLNQTLDILNKYRTTEGAFGAEEISGEYKINKNVADNVVRYYELFNMMETNTRENEHDPPDPLTAGTIADIYEFSKTIYYIMDLLFCRQRLGRHKISGR